MADIAFLATVVAFFILCIGDTNLCGRIIGPDEVAEVETGFDQEAWHARNLPVDQVVGLIGAGTDDRAFGLLGEPAVNVLCLNLALDKLTS
jgi:hypothetical protein